VAAGNRRRFPEEEARSTDAFAPIRCSADASLIRRAILVDKLPLAFHEQGLEVVIGIASFVARRSVADFEVHDFFGGFVYQAVSVSRARLETCAHAWTELDSTFVSVQRWPTLEDVDELVLPGVGMTKG
jgi:hypothetical protein